MELLFVALLFGPTNPTANHNRQAINPSHGVVLPESAGIPLRRPRLCNRPMPWPIEGTWTPEPTVIARLELRLGPALSEALARAPSSRFPKPEVQGFYRQYLGFVVGGRRIVYINGAHERVVQGARNAEDWKTIAWNGCDGGLLLFGAEYDPAADTIDNVIFNGGGRGGSV
ncbi:MAG: hypothetical protein NUW22_14915 [Acidobacteria bacterium]|nr:hypothetical protein [Acidobacteriota bacterium]